MKRNTLATARIVSDMPALPPTVTQTTSTPPARAFWNQRSLVTAWMSAVASTMRQSS